METLLRQDLTNRHRVRWLIEDAVASQGLDLRGIWVLTEVGIGAYPVTPVIAALGVAEQVFAMTGDSVYAGSPAPLARLRSLTRLVRHIPGPSVRLRKCGEPTDCSINFGDEPLERAE